MALTSSQSHGFANKGDTLDLPDIETVAGKVHEAWMRQKRSQGVATRRTEQGEELMVPYGELSEAAKELDRESVRAVYAAIRDVAATRGMIL
jgi:hypothetical protein